MQQNRVLLSKNLAARFGRAVFGRGVLSGLSRGRRKGVKKADMSRSLVARGVAAFGVGLFAAVLQAQMLEPVVDKPVRIVESID